MEVLGDTGTISEAAEDRLVVWWGPDLDKEDVFVLPIATVEEGVRLLGVLTSYDQFLEDKKFKVETVSNGAIAFLTPAGELKPWSYVSIAHGGKKFEDPMEWLEAKYSQSQIIT